jgi:multiple sugar transport system permease protein
MAIKTPSYVTFLKYLLLSIAALFVLFPFAWMIIGSLKPLNDYYKRPVQFIFKPYWENYFFAIKNLGLFKHTLNSIIVAGSVAVIQVLTSTHAAFAFSMMQFPVKNALFAVVMATMMMPFSVMLVPLFMIVQFMGISNTYAAMIVPFGFTGFGIFLMRQSFLSLPKDLFSAAEIDGAGYYRILWQIYMPLVLPGIMSLSIIVFINYFNSILWPIVAVSSESMMVLAVRMISMVSFDRILEPNKIMCIAAICIIPPLIVFVSLQRFFVKGYLLSGMKG